MPLYVLMGSISLMIIIIKGVPKRHAFPILVRWKSFYFFTDTFACARKSTSKNKMDHQTEPQRKSKCKRQTVNINANEMKTKQKTFLISIMYFITSNMSMSCSWMNIIPNLEVDTHSYIAPFNRRHSNITITIENTTERAAEW